MMPEDDGIQSGYDKAEGLGGSVSITGEQGASFVGAVGAKMPTCIAIGHDVALGAGNKAYIDKAIRRIFAYHGSFTAGTLIYSDILNTIEITCQEDGLDLLVECGQEELFYQEFFFTIEGEERAVSDWRDSWLSYINVLERN